MNVDAYTVIHQEVRVINLSLLSNTEERTLHAELIKEDWFRDHPATEPEATQATYRKWL